MTMWVDRGKVNDAKTILAGMGLTDPTGGDRRFSCEGNQPKSHPVSAGEGSYSEYALIEYGPTRGGLGRIHPASFDG